MSVHIEIDIIFERILLDYLLNLACRFEAEKKLPFHLALGDLLLPLFCIRWRLLA